MDDALQQDIEMRVEALGFEVVELTQAGAKTRPILQIRIDRVNAAPTELISVDDCARVSRDVEALLDERPDLGERYVLEVSSPGLERPLTKPRDFERFAGKQVAIRTTHAVGDLGKRVEGVLLGISNGDVVRLDVNGQVLEIERSDIKKAHLVFTWDDAKQKK